MKRILMLLVSVCCAMGVTLQAQVPAVVAHRGFWRTEGSAQNSLAGLLKGDSIGCEAVELDVWLTSDDVLVVNHDATFKGVIMQEATADVCTAVRLDNGERLPTLQQFLEAARPLHTRLVIELKAHRSAWRETQAVERLVALVQASGLGDRVEYISFSLHATQELIRLAPSSTPVYYLNGDLPPHLLKAMGCAGPDYHFSAFHQHPDWIAECHRLGLKVNVWTVDDAKEMEWLISQGVDFITTNEPLTLQHLLSKRFANSH